MDAPVGRFAWSFVYAAVLGAAASKNALAQQAPQPVPSPMASVAGSPAPAGGCARGPGDFASVSVRDAFARSIGDRSTLRFLDRLERTEGSALSSLLTAVLAQPPPGIPNVTDEETGCRVADIPFAVRRAWVVESMRWHLTVPRAVAVLPHVGVAIDALARRDQLDPVLVAAALAPFGTSAAELASEAPPATTCPAPIDARIDGTAVEPYFPAGGDRTTQVDVEVALTQDGFVRSATFMQSTFGMHDDVAFLDPSIAAAGVTSYLPPIVNCLRTEGRYKFRATYSIG